MPGRVMFILVLCFASAPILAACGEELGMVKTGEALVAKIDGWELKGDPERYSGEGIYDYMDGAGELYRLFGYRELVVARYGREGEPEILVEIFEMGRSNDAFGVFTHAREGPSAGVGSDSYSRSGLLCFWKGRFFVCLSSAKGGGEIARVLPILARALAERLGPAAERPALLGYLPVRGLEPSSIRYFHRSESLDYHYFLSDENILHLDATTDVVLAEYRREKKRSTLLVVAYASGEKAGAALKSFKAAYMPEAGRSGVVRIENGTWTAAKADGRFLVLALDGSGKREVLNRIGETFRRMEGANHER
jgi:hypothetical protein